jgi:hypothetical protein
MRASFISASSSSRDAAPKTVATGATASRATGTAPLLMYSHCARAIRAPASATSGRAARGPPSDCASIASARDKSPSKTRPSAISARCSRTRAASGRGRADSMASACS